MLSVTFRPEIEDILSEESSGKKNKKKNVKRTFKEMVKNIQEMLIIGAGIHTKIFKTQDR